MYYKFPSTFEKLLGRRANLPNAVEHDGVKWFVGSGIGGEYPINLDDIIRYYPIVVKKVLKDLGKKSEKAKEEGIVVSLPSEVYLEDFITGGKIIQLIQNSIMEIGVNSVEVLPQGIIALQKVFSEEGLKRERTLVIDGGFYTVNLGIMDKNGDILFVKTYYNEFGIRDLLEKYFLPEIKDKYPEITKNMQILKTAFLTGELEKGFKTYKVEDEKRIAVQNYIESLFNRVVKDVERNYLNFKNFAIVGGLSYYVSPSDIDTNKDFYIPSEDGEFYTAFGMNVYSSGKLSIDFGFGDTKVVYSS